MIHRLLVFAAAAALLTAATPPMSAGAQGRDSTRKDTTWSSARSDARAHALADSLRVEILRLATFAGFAANDSMCAQGDIRTFEKDTTQRYKQLLARFEQLVVSYGAFELIDNSSGRALMRAVVRLETGGPGPRWDVLKGPAPRAFNPMLPVRTLNTDTKRCELLSGRVPDGIVLPPLTNFVPPKDSGAVDFITGYGFEGLNSLRDFYFAHHKNDSTAVLRDTRVNAYAIWQDYAVIGIVRESELHGVVPLPNESSGVAYAFHRVGSEWRLLALIRTW